MEAALPSFPKGRGIGIRAENFDEMVSSLSI
jgi:hypothetical protein